MVAARYLCKGAELAIDQRSDFMRALCPILAITALLATSHSAPAESKWLGTGRLDVSEIKVLCDRVSDVRLLGRMQMITSDDDRWRRLSRQELVIEATAMGVVPLDPSRCYVIAHAGSVAEGERRAFEVLEFISSDEQTSIFVVGRAYDAPHRVTPPDSR